MKVVVSGASSGIGLSVVEKFLAEGHEVFGVDIAVSRLDHPSYTHFCADIRGELPNIGGIEIIINCAGTIDEREAIEINLSGNIAFTDHYLDRSTVKSVLFIASASARNGAEFPMYVASKAGIIGYMKNLAFKLSSCGATCNSISPGGVITPMNAHIIDSEELYRAVKNETLLGKWAEPSEIADLAYFLTVINKSMTGEDLLIDNGEMLKSNFIW